MAIARFKPGYSNINHSQFLRELKAVNPHRYDKLMSMPEEDREWTIANGINICGRLNNCGPSGAMELMEDLGIWMVKEKQDPRLLVRAQERKRERKEARYK